jgi:iron complex outermembrane receptor protein
MTRRPASCALVLPVLVLLAPADARSQEDLLEDLDFERAMAAPRSTETGLENLLDTAVVTATKQKQSISAAPAIISVITGSQIRRWGYRTVGEALRRLPGLYPIHDHVRWNYGVRGVNGGMRAGSRILKVMIDGQPVSFRPSSENWLGEELIPIQTVERIEVIRGPTSALYGADAYLGVINIITRSGAAVDGAQVMGRVGAVQGHAAGGGSFVAGTKRGALEVLLAASGSHTDRSGLRIGNLPGAQTYRAPRDASAEDTSAPVSVFAKLAYDSRALGRLSLDLGYQRLHSHGEFMDWGVLARGGQADPIDPRHVNLISLQNVYLRARLVSQLLDELRLGLSSSFVLMGPTPSDRLSINDKGLGDYFTRDVGTTGADFVGELIYTLREINTFTLGLDVTMDIHELQTYYSVTRLQTGSFTRTIIEPTDYDVLGTKLFHNVGTYFQSVLYPFALLRIGRLETLGLIFNIRWDHHGVYGDVVNYRAGSVLFKEKLLNAKVLFGTSFKAPTSIQLYTTRLGIRSVKGNPDLRPESAQTLELLVGTDIVDGLTANLSGFYTVVDDKVEFVPDQKQTSNVIAKNLTNVTSLGLEADLHFRTRDLLSYLNLSFQRSRVKKLDNITYEEITVDAALYPAWMLKFGGSYQLPSIHLCASLEGRFISARLSSDQNSKSHDPIHHTSYELDPYFVMDLSLSTVGLRLIGERETFMQAKVYNLTGQDYLYPGFGDYDIPALGTTFLFTVAQQL